MAAGISAMVMQVKKDIIRESLSDFKGIEHRLEQVLSIRGVEYVNDSKATNVNSTWYALECQRKRVIWIAGGTDKCNDYSDLIPLVKEKVKTLICLGVDNSKLLKVFGEIIPVKETKSMKDAIAEAYKIAQKGDVVLLSPACASFDLFQNYEDRGRQFKECVRAL